MRHCARWCCFQDAPLKKAAAAGMVAASILVSAALGPQLPLTSAARAEALVEAGYETEANIEIQKEKINYRLSQEVGGEPNPVSCTRTRRSWV